MHEDDDENEVLRRMWALAVDTATMVQYWKARGGCTWSMPALCGTGASLWPREWLWFVAMAGWNPSHSQQLLDLGLDRFSVHRD